MTFTWELNNFLKHEHGILSDYYSSHFCLLNGNETGLKECLHLFMVKTAFSAVMSSRVNCTKQKTAQIAKLICVSWASHLLSFSSMLLFYKEKVQ